MQITKYNRARKSPKRKVRAFNLKEGEKVEISWVFTGERLSFSKLRSR